MKSTAVRANLLDASALVKLYVKEDGSAELKRYTDSQGTVYTTPFCFYETLNVLKTKWLYRKEISHDEYLKKSFALSAWFSVISRSMKHLDFLSFESINDVKKLAQKHELDLSDAFQILSVRKDYYSGLIGESKTLFITADKKLADAARQEGVRAWHFIREPEP